ncbi:MAG: hypothetical protein HYY23_14570 [Verrucomicrobia bacterium]|nr:hypothetical protein [Verrucomicrobiota bacterium]
MGTEKRLYPRHPRDPRLKPRACGTRRTGSLGLEMEELREPVIALDGKNIAFTAGGIKSEVWVMENFWPKEKVAAK